MSVAPISASPQEPAGMTHWPRWAVLAQGVAATWSLAYLGLGIAWLMGAGGNPADPAVDDGVALSVLATWGPRVGALLIAGLAAAGVALTAVMALQRSSGGRPGLLRRAPPAAVGTRTRHGRRGPPPPAGVAGPPRSP